MKFPLRKLRISLVNVTKSSGSGISSTKIPLKLNHNHIKFLSEENFEEPYYSLQSLLVKTSVLLFKRTLYLDIIHNFFENTPGFDNNFYICDTSSSKLRKNKIPCQAVFKKLHI